MKTSEKEIDLFDEIDEDSEVIEILSDEEKSSKEYESVGWKFYLKLKNLLPVWWEEFNGSVKYKNHGNHFRSIESFAKKKLKDHKERQWFVLMCGPKKVWEIEAIGKHGNKKVVPWIGDWELRRKNGYWVTNKGLVSSLKKAVRENLESGKAIRATAPFIVRILMRRARLIDKINEKFQGEPFYDDEKIDSKKNIQRFKAYREMLLSAENDIFTSIHEWMRIHGVNPKNPHEMADMATLAHLAGQVGAVGALTGMQAGMGLTPTENGHVLNLEDGQVLVNRDALLLATQLANHQKMSKRNLPILEAEEIEVSQVKKEKVNGHGKHTN